MILLHVLENDLWSGEKEQMIAAATKRLDRLILPEIRNPLKMKVTVRVGKPYQEIVQFAQEAQVDMVVMGVHGRGALDLAVFGSTTYRVIQLGSSPVLVVHV